MRDETKSACRVCGTSLPAAGRGRPRAYCSRGCQAKAYRRRRSPPPPAAGPATTDLRSPRRRQIAEAVWRIAAERGLQAASMREVALEAGVSLRVVQYHFTGKHRLLVTALYLLHEDNERRARERIGALRDPVTPRALLQAIMSEFLPLDDRRRTALRVFAAYYARSLTDPALAAVFLSDADPLEQLVAAVIRQAQEQGAAPARLDPGHEADLLVSGVSGLGMDVLHGRRTIAQVRRVIDYHLDRILAPTGG
ncbi:TetR/AcrR family transcriptional regulator [Planomonospora sp. ID82291]|uniref:TetR/AcrR family transcriptional regulator n=1 Tax=Planomonospora sp. ID82291 TaxID=2738136 RepID=UPI0018C3EE53|nr:TetR/AcrR family transcriptional regulator [Planomonospora sp. ID82291]MBG0814065.1 TetR/AcrR family transcriptional regulator [Planomonospora sp. ID82291]